MIKFIGVEEKYDYKIVLPFEIRRATPDMLNDPTIVEEWIAQIKEQLKTMDYVDDITEIIPVTEHVGKWVKGDYYAHEYGTYADGKARKVELRDADGELVHTEYEVVCLDENLFVADGYWDDIGASRIYSGTGDEFVPYSPMD